MNNSIIDNISTNSSIIDNMSTNSSIINNISVNSSSILNEIILNNTGNAATIVTKIDPNWFYSASAQSAAAIVGLMGAFLTTKILNQKFYVKQLCKEIDELDVKIEHVKNEITTNEDLLNILNSDEGINILISEYEFDPSTNPNYNMCRIIESMPAGHMINLRLEEYRNYMRMIENKKRELLSLENTLLYKTDQVESNNEFLDLRKYFTNLILFSILGVFVPLFMMLFDYDTMVRFRLISYFLIVIGWTFILISLYGEINNLRGQKRPN